jgi:mandelate racemase
LFEAVLQKEVAMISISRLSVCGLRARAVDVPVQPPLETASAEIRSAPLVLVDLLTEEGVTGQSYVFCVTALALAPMARLVSNLGPLIEGDAVAPLAIEEKLQGRFRLLGPQGLTGMALAAVDVAAWDALAKAHDLPLVELLGSERRPIPAYASLKAMGRERVAEEARGAIGSGFGAVKARIGHPAADRDVEVVRAVRSAIGESVDLMVDYNQVLSVPDAVSRAHALDDEGLYWIEEPTRADDFAGHARISREARTHIQIGENWWGPHDMAKSLAAGASDLAMPDVIKIGGVSGWLRAAALAEAAGMPASSHLYPEISAHLLAVTPTRDRLEYLDLAGPLLKEPLRIEDGHAVIPASPGTGVEWEEESVRRYLVD